MSLMSQKCQNANYRVTIEENRIEDNNVAAFSFTSRIELELNNGLDDRNNISHSRIELELNNGLDDRNNISHNNSPFNVVEEIIKDNSKKRKRNSKNSLLKRHDAQKSRKNEKSQTNDTLNCEPISRIQIVQSTLNPDILNPNNSNDNVNNNNRNIVNELLNNQIQKIQVPRTTNYII